MMKTERGMPGQVWWKEWDRVPESGGPSWFCEVDELRGYSPWWRSP